MPFGKRPVPQVSSLSSDKEINREPRPIKPSLNEALRNSLATLDSMSRSQSFVGMGAVEVAISRLTDEIIRQSRMAEIKPQPPRAAGEEG